MAFGSERVLDGIDVTIRSGTSVAIVGPSGAGKSTLLNVIAGLIEPVEGSVRLPGIAEDLWQLTDRQRAAARLRHIGLVFQLPTFISDLTMLDNVALPLVAAGQSRRVARNRAGQLTSELGVDHLDSAYPDTPSGGELQRVAIARAIVSDPAILLCDEPTGSLDEANAQAVADLLYGTVRRGRTLVVVTHSSHMAKRADETVVLRRRGKG